MIGLSLGIALGGKGSILDPAVASFLSRTGITNPTQKNAISALVAELKVESIWDKFFAIYPFVGGTSATHAENLVDVTFPITWTGSATHNANGVTSSAGVYGDTGIATNAFPSGNLSFGVYSRTSSSIASKDIDATIGGIFIRYTDNNTYTDNYEATGRIVSSVADSLGLFSSSRTSNALHTAYRNATSIGTTTGAQGTLTAHTFIVGNTTRNLAFAYIAQGFSGAEMSVLYTAVQTFQTSLGRQV